MAEPFNPLRMPFATKPVYSTAERVQAEEAAAMRGTCPACGFWNHPDSDAQIGQEQGLLYCVNCGSTWRPDAEATAE